MQGEYPIIQIDPTYLSRHGADTQWYEIKGKIKLAGTELEFRKHKTTDTYILGYFEEVEETNYKVQEIKTKFRCVGRIDYTMRSALAKTLANKYGKYRNILNINSIYLEERFREVGIATAFHIWLVQEQGFSIMGDGVQYFGYRKLWSRLSKNKNLVVDIVDIQKKAIIASNVSIHQGDIEADIDTRFYSLFPDKSKEHIVPILTTVG